MIDGSKGTVNRLIQVLSDNDLLSSSGNRDVTLLNSRQSIEYRDEESIESL